MSVALALSNKTPSASEEYAALSAATVTLTNSGARNARLPMLVTVLGIATLVRPVP